MVAEVGDPIRQRRSNRSGLSDGDALLPPSRHVVLLAAWYHRSGGRLRPTRSSDRAVDAVVQALNVPDHPAERGTIDRSSGLPPDFQVGQRLGDHRPGVAVLARLADVFQMSTNLIAHRRLSYGLRGPAGIPEARCRHRETLSSKSYGGHGRDGRRALATERNIWKGGGPAPEPPGRAIGSDSNLGPGGTDAGNWTWDGKDIGSGFEDIQVIDQELTSQCLFIHTHPCIEMRNCTGAARSSPCWLCFPAG